MIDKNNNITLIFVLLFVVLIVFYYDKNYEVQIENFKKKIEQFKNENLKNIETSIEYEKKHMNNIKNYMNFLFNHKNKDQNIWVKEKDGNIENIRKTKPTTDTQLWKEQTLSSILDTDKLINTNNNIHTQLGKIDYSKLRKDISNYVQTERISNINSEISKLKIIGKNELNSSVNSIKNSYNNKTLNMKKLNNEILRQKIPSINPHTDYYHIKIDDPQKINEVKKNEQQIKDLGGEWVNKSWQLNYDKNKYDDKNNLEYKNKIDENMNKIKELIEKNKQKKVQCLSFDNNNKSEPYLLTDCDEKENSSQLMTVHNIKSQDGCFNMENNEFVENITNSECIKNLKQELRPNKDKFICNYNQHVNYPYTINENETEFLPNTFSIIKPFNFTPPGKETQPKKQSMYNEYMYAFDNQMIFDNEKTEDDKTYNDKCINKYNFPQKKKNIESCLTIDKEGISFQDCNLRKNQRWLPSEKKTYC